MLKLNFLLVLRKIRKDKKSFLVNLIGSSIGLTAIVLMLLYINYENNYDDFNESVSKLYRVERTVNDNVQNQIFDSTPYELPEELKTSFPEIIEATSVRHISNYLSVKDELYSREKGLIADNNFLNMFSLDFIDGDRLTVLKQPMSIILSESLANKLFPEGNVLGKTIKADKKFNLRVTGIFKDYPKDSHMSMSYLISFNSYLGLYGVKKEKGWNENYSSTYVMLGENAKANVVSGKIENVLGNHIDFKDGQKHLLSFRPIRDIYMKTLNVRTEVMGGMRNSIVVIYLFILVAFFTAFVTTVNYINLTTTQLTSRELEIGMKKVLGISKTQLRYQFMLESLVMVVSIIVLSSLLVLILLPLFSSVVDRPLSIDGNGLFFLKFFIFSILFGILSGLYPVFYLASLKITSFLQGNTSIKRRRRLRKGLVFFQLFITIPLMFLSYHIMSQINYLKDKDLGFSQENVLIAMVKTSEKQDFEKLKVIKNTLLQNPNIINYSLAECAPFIGYGEEKKLNWEDNKRDDKVTLTTYGVDYDFKNAFEMEVLKGRWFSKEHSTDKESSCIINETTASLLGWKNPIGKTIDNGKLKVIGVVKDFNQVSLLKKISPMMLTMNSESIASTAVSIKISGTDITETRKSIDDTFNSHFAEIPIEFKFLEDGFDEGYMSALENVMRIFILFSIISVLLVIIGLYSLISFSLKMQKNMIAVRKVLGSSTKELFKLILKEYLIIYSIAAILGLSLTYFLILQVSQIGAYNTSVSPLAFIIVILTTLFIVLLTISGKIWSASVENPINAINLE